MPKVSAIYMTFLAARVTFRLLEADQSCHGLAVAFEDDLLSRLDSGDELREAPFGFLYSHAGHFCQRDRIASTSLGHAA
jgi:hypothetical protein